MKKNVIVHGHDLNVKIIHADDENVPEVNIKNSRIDFNAQPEKVMELMKVLGLKDDVSVEVRVTTASTIVE